MRGGLLYALSALALLSGCTPQSVSPTRAQGATIPAASILAEPPDQIVSEDWPQPAPRFHGGPEAWINTEGKPLKLERGKVYLIDFWEYTCVNCLRTLPYLAEWNRRYAKDGLVIVGIHTPEFAFAKDRANVAASVKRLGITWPILVDSEYTNWQAFHNQFWPRKYFVDSTGRIVADHAGEGGYGESELRLQELLKQAHPGLKFPKPMEAVRGSDKPGAVCYPTTPEIYAGERGHQEDQHGNLADFEIGKTFTLPPPVGELEDGKIYAQGSWTTERESLRHGRDTQTLDDKLFLRYHALECNAVIKPEGTKPYRVYLTQDGKPIPKADKGDDVSYDERGDSYITVEQPRLYSLTKNVKFGAHTLTLASGSPDFGLYSFTFSSCELPK